MNTEANSKVVTESRIENVVQETMGDRTFYFGTIGSDKIKSVSFVPVIEASTRT